MFQVDDSHDYLYLSILSTHRLGGNQKHNHQSRNVGQKSIETVFLIAIGDKWQSKTLFLLIFDLRSLIVLVFSIAAYPVWSKDHQNPFESRCWLQVSVVHIYFQGLICSIVPE